MVWNRAEARSHSLMRAIGFVLMLVVAGCGSPMAPSDIRPTEHGALTCSGALCSFVGTLRNLGTGCATKVRGTLTLQSAPDLATIGTYDWLLLPDRLVRRDETLTIVVAGIPYTVAQFAAGHRIEATWTKTRCPT